MTTTTEITNKANAIVGGMTIQQLAVSVLVVEKARHDCERGSDEWRAASQMFIWITEEIERRYDVDDAMNAWADDDSHGMTYAEALIAALPAGTI